MAERKIIVRKKGYTRQTETPVKSEIKPFETVSNWVALYKANKPNYGKETASKMLFG